jgi:hypothetical protein
MRKGIPLLGLTLLVFAAAAGAEECRYSAPRNVDLDGLALKSLLLNLGATDAHVRGVAGLTKVEVRGTACASNPQWLADLRIDTTRSGGSATVTARTGDHGTTFGLFGFSHYAYIKLSVSVPPQLAVAIDSGSGDVVARALSSLDFHSGSGDLRADEINGALALQLGSGDVDAQRVGTVELRSTNSGDVAVNGVRGDVHAGHVGSGDLHFSNVGGSVWVESIGSGDVIVDDVGGDLYVGAAGSGDVLYRSVKGTVRVPKDD